MVNTGDRATPDPPSSSPQSPSDSGNRASGTAAPRLFRRAEVRTGLKNVAYNKRRLVQLKRFAMDGGP
jgi:hypothetical protein